MHGARNIGIHSKKHHQTDYLELLEKGIIVEIGDCPNTLWQPCKDPHDREATEQEIQLALSLKDKQMQRIKEQNERWARGDFTEPRTEERS
jgi:hypothetical protein